MSDTAFPSLEEEDYENWTPPEHEHTYVTDNTVTVGIRGDDGVLRKHVVSRCTQCEHATAVPTDEEVPTIR